MASGGELVAEPVFEIRELGRLSYARAYEIQKAVHEQVKNARESANPIAGIILCVEHHPVITVSRRMGAEGHLLASRELLEQVGVEVCETDRGGDITYHGPGQVVLYPIVDLNLLNIGLHEYMRLMEEAVIETCSDYGIHAAREPGATGVWVPGSIVGRGAAAKICAMGVRVSRWVSMHGLALNVTTNLEHFNLIVPCGLVGRAVTSIHAERHMDPTHAEVSVALANRLIKHLRAALAVANQKRGTRVVPPESAG